MNWPTDDKFRKFAALVADGVMYAECYNVRERKCCPLGAACAMLSTSYWQSDGAPLFPVCDVSANSFAAKLGGDENTWLDECRHFEVGFDGDDPKGECVPRRDPFYLLGCEYRKRLSDREPS